MLLGDWGEKAPREKRTVRFLCPLNSSLETHTGGSLLALLPFSSDQTEVTGQSEHMSPDAPLQWESVLQGKMAAPQVGMADVGCAQQWIIFLFGNLK